MSIKGQSLQHLEMLLPAAPALQMSLFLFSTFIKKKNTFFLLFLWEHLEMLLALLLCRCPFSYFFHLFRQFFLWQHLEMLLAPGLQMFLFVFFLPIVFQIFFLHVITFLGPRGPLRTPSFVRPPVPRQKSKSPPTPYKSSQDTCQPIKP